MFFFKQKTAYEMRISDWSSDVCSSDLMVGDAVHLRHPQGEGGRHRRPCARAGCLPWRHQRQAGDRGLGIDLRADPSGGAPPAGEGPRRQPYPTTPCLAAAKEPWRAAEEL